MSIWQTSNIYLKSIYLKSNIKLAGYHDFIYTPTQTSHGESGFYTRDTLAFKRRNDLLLNPPDTGDFESTFLEIVLPNKKTQLLVVFTDTLPVQLH